MPDAVFTAFLERQLEEGLALAAASDRLELLPAMGRAPDRYLARFRCRGIVRAPNGDFVEADDWRVGIWFPPDYLIGPIEPFEVVTWLAPNNVYHPNIRPPFICPGRLVIGTPLVDVLYQCYEVISYQRFNPREDNCLNIKACVWAREESGRGRFPVDRRPLKRPSRVAA